jgi:hypothetical protein
MKHSEQQKLSAFLPLVGKTLSGIEFLVYRNEEVTSLLGVILKAANSSLFTLCGGSDGQSIVILTENTFPDYPMNLGELGTTSFELSWKNVDPALIVCYVIVDASLIYDDLGDINGVILKFSNDEGLLIFNWGDELQCELHESLQSELYQDLTYSH